MAYWQVAREKLHKRRQRRTARWALFLCALSAQSNAIELGTWDVGSTDDGATLYAATTNDSGALFVQYCYPEAENCVWALGISTGCEKGAQYPGLLNSDDGPLPVTLICRGGVEKISIYIFSDFDQIDSAARKAKKIGIAIPLSGDQFRVFRFRLDGTAGALDIMRDATQKAIAKKTSGKRTGKSGTKDIDM